MTKHCKQPDRDVPNIVCGYPLPCPHHTAVIDLADRTITVPGPDYEESARKAAKLRRIADALVGDP